MKLIADRWMYASAGFALAAVLFRVPRLTRGAAEAK